MNPQTLVRAALALAIALPFSAIAGTLDKEKLKLLACSEPDNATKEGKQAAQWLNSIVVERGEQRSIAGQIILDQACMANVNVATAFGVLSVTGEVCNTKLDDFSAALKRAGVTLASTPVPEYPHVLLTLRKDKHAFTVFKGKLNLANNTLAPSEQLSFMCANQQSGPQ